ncbi:hypothetical protein JOD55_000341 [Arcanobacterium pluranimalium]|nr:hypothetical protein [Arcanobacterium pluranimalium]
MYLQLDKLTSTILAFVNTFFISWQNAGILAIVRTFLFINGNLT